MLSLRSIRRGAHLLLTNRCAAAGKILSGLKVPQDDSESEEVAQSEPRVTGACHLPELRTVSRMET
jgi:hypothetical protein